MPARISAIVLDREQCSTLEDIIGNLQAFRNTGQMAFFIDAVHAVDELGRELVELHCTDPAP